MHFIGAIDLSSIWIWIFRALNINLLPFRTTVVFPPTHSPCNNNNPDDSHDCKAPTPVWLCLTFFPLNLHFCPHAIIAMVPKGTCSNMMKSKENLWLGGPLLIYLAWVSYDLLTFSVEKLNGNNHLFPISKAGKKYFFWFKKIIHWWKKLGNKSLPSEPHKNLFGKVYPLHMILGFWGVQSHGCERWSCLSLTEKKKTCFIIFWLVLEWNNSKV